MEKSQIKHHIKRTAIVKVEGETSCTENLKVFVIGMMESEMKKMLFRLSHEINNFQRAKNLQIIIQKEKTDANPVL